MANDLITTLAQEQGLDAKRYWDTVCGTVIKGKATTEQIVAFLAVANQYGLNPLTKEIYAFPSNGGISPIVSVDGWLKLANNNPQFDGLETEEIREDNEIIAVRCTVWRKDRSRPTTATEYMAECKRNTEPWKQWPVRMLTNKAMIQAIRRAFSFAGIYDQDEGERIKQATEVEYEDVSDRSSVAQAATESKTEEIKQKIAKAQGKGEALSDQGAEGDTKSSSPKESEPSAPISNDNETGNDFDLMEVEALILWLEDHKRPGNGQDTKMVNSAAKSGNRESIVALCRSFANR